MNKLLPLFFIFLLAFIPMIAADQQDPYLEISKGNIPGHSVIHKFGHNLALSTNIETIWSGSNLYTYPAAATLMNLTSTQANDTMASNGAWNVTVYGLDANYNFINETIALNGTTPTSSINQYLRVYRMQTRSGGVSGHNDGIIYLGTGATVAGVPTNIYAMIDATYGQTQMTQFTIPAGYSGYLTHIDGTCYTVNKNFIVYLRLRNYGELWRYVEEWHLGSGETIPNGGPPYKIEARTDIEFDGVVDVAGASTEINYDLILVKDGYSTVYDNVQSNNNILLYLLIIAALLLVAGYFTRRRR